MVEHSEGDLLTYPDGKLAVSKNGETFSMIRSGNVSCRGCCFGPHSKCQNGYNLCVKYQGDKYRDWVYEVKYEALAATEPKP